MRRSIRSARRPAGVLAITVVLVVGVSLSPAISADTVIATVPVGDSPVAVGVNPVSHHVYVANYYGDSVTVIDGESDTVTATISMPVGASVAIPDAVVVDALAEPAYAYVANYWSQKLAVIDEASLATTVVVDLAGTHAGGPRALALDPTASPPLLYVANYGDGTVSVIDLSTHTLLTDIAVSGSSPRALGIHASPTRRRIFVADRYANAVDVIDGESLTITATIAVGEAPKAIAVDPDTGYAYVTNELSDSVSVIDDSDTLAATIPVGDAPKGVAVDAEGDRVFVVNAGSGTVSVIDAGSLSVTATVDVGSNPYAVAYDPSSAKAFVTDYDSDTVSVIATDLGVTTVSVGDRPYAVCVDDGGAVPKAYVGNWGADSVSVIDESDSISEWSILEVAEGADTQWPVAIGVDPFPQDRTLDRTPTVTGSATSVRIPRSSGIVAVLFRVDDDTRWRRGDITAGGGTDDASWTLTVGEPLSPGSHRLEVAAFDQASAVQATSDFGSAVAAPTVGEPTTYLFEVVDELDQTPPEVRDLSVSPRPVQEGAPCALEAVADDSPTGGSLIASAQYRVDGGAWTSMNAADGAFDEVVEEPVATFVLSGPGLHMLEVRASDVAGNVSDAVGLRVPCRRRPDRSLRLSAANRRILR
jgi:YVTN family beta-propeller protein